MFTRVCVVYGHCALIQNIYMSNELLQAGTGIPGNNILFSNGLLDDRLN